MEDNNEKKAKVENTGKEEKVEKAKAKTEKAVQAQKAQGKPQHEQKKAEKFTSIIRIGA